MKDSSEPCAWCGAPGPHNVLLTTRGKTGKACDTCAVRLYPGPLGKPLRFDEPGAPLVYDEHARNAVRKIRGEWMINVANCLHCGRIVIAPQRDGCLGCGAEELADVSKLVRLGVGYLPEELAPEPGARETS